MENYENKKRDSKGKASVNEKRIELEARLIRQTLLAKPSARRLLPFPDPNLFFIGERTVSQSALIYKPSKRILLLCKFKPRMFSSKYTKPEPPKHCVNPEALVFKPTPRILELASLATGKKEGPKKPKKRDVKKFKKMRKFIQNRPAWLELRAGPKPVPQPPPLEKFKPAVILPPEEREARIRILAEPKHKYEPPEEAPTISKAALKYTPSKRVLEMSSPKELDPQTILNITYNPFKIKRAALNYKPTERMNVLAVPNVRKKQEDTDVKEHPFSVLPRALTAICTKRVKELAKPIERD